MAGRDPQERAKGSDREAALDLVELAHAEGRIGSADRTIRKNNVATAATLGELDMITQDLTDREPGSVEPGPSVLQPTLQEQAPQPAMAEPTGGGGAGPAPQGGPLPRPPGPSPSFGLPPDAWMTRRVTVTRRGGGAPVLIALFAALIGVAIAGSVFFTTIGIPEVDLGQFDPNQAPEGVEDGYALDAEGFAWVIAEYRKSTGTTESWQTQFYEDHAIFFAPNDDGSDSREGYVYRAGRFAELGSTPLPNPAGEDVVNLRRLDVAALERSMGQALTGLGVERAEVTHISVRDDGITGRPTVSIHVSNRIGQSAFLQTDLRGRLIREFPYAG